MSDYIKRDIADYIINALIAVDDLDRVKLFLRGGAPFEPPIGLHPYVEVEIAEETPDEDFSGGVYQQTYTGLITINTLASPDWLTVQGRKASVPSYDEVEELLIAIEHELQDDAHATLGNLANDDNTEVVLSFWMTGPRVYGLDNRTDNYTNFGSLPFEVTTQRSL